MRRNLAILIVTLLALALLSSCGKSQSNATAYSPAQIAEAIIAAQDGMPSLEPLLPDDEYYAFYITDIYRLDIEAIKNGAIYYGGGMQAEEIAVFLLTDSSGLKDAKDALTQYKQQRSEAFMGYAPEQAAMLENGSVITNGNYLALLICENPQQAGAVFLQCFSDNPPEINGEKAMPQSGNGGGSLTDDRQGANENESAPIDPRSGSDSPGSGNSSSGEASGANMQDEKANAANIEGSGASDNATKSGETASGGSANGGSENSERVNDGATGNGASGSEASGNGESGAGDTGSSASGSVETNNGGTDNAPSGSGATESGTTGSVAPGNGDSGSEASGNSTGSGSPTTDNGAASGDSSDGKPADGGIENNAATNNNDKANSADNAGNNGSNGNTDNNSNSSNPDNTNNVGNNGNNSNNGNPDSSNSSTNTEIEDVYDKAAVLKAWQSGDKTGLTEKNRLVLEACIEVIKTLVRDNMNDYEKELVIHDWIVDWASYDEETMSNSPNAKPAPDNDNPYGTIYYRKAICSGYTSTFQLFMDMLGIECITVNGIYTSLDAEHAWNMVRIDGDWYCVDVTWNDPIGGYQTVAIKHKYFNVTSRYMIDTRHEWDESKTPVANSGKLYIGTTD